METPKGFKEVEQPDVVKFVKVGDSVEGKFLSIEESKKYKESYAVTFREVKSGALSVVFVSSQGYDLFVRSKVKYDQEFVLLYEDNKKAEESGMEYRIFRLFVK